MSLPAISRPPVMVDEGTASAVRDLRCMLLKSHEQPFMLLTPDGQSLELPDAITSALREVADALAAGDAVSILPIHQQLSTNQAARLLGISRPTLVGLLERGEIPCSMVGTHRRVRLTDVLVYRERRDREATAQLDAILTEAQEHGGYF